MRYFLAGALIVASATLTAQDQQVWVNVLIKGKAVMGFVPAPDQSSQDQRGVDSAVDEAGARTKDGMSIRAFEFRGWKEGDGYRVEVFAIGPGLKRIEFDSFLIKAGEERIISKMKDAGVTPWVIRVGRKEAWPTSISAKWQS